MKRLFIPLCTIALTTYACGNTAKQESENDSTADTTVTVSETPAEVKSVLQAFPELTPSQTSSKAGEYVLAPSHERVEEFMSGQSASLNFNKAVMAEPGDQSSFLNITFEGKKELPNYLIIPIPAEQTVKKGDVVLTWWQRGSGLQRAIVIDDSNPNEPEIHYLDLDWELMVKNNKFTEKIEANSFVKITEPWQSGASLIAKEGTNTVKYTLLTSSADKILVDGFAGVTKVLDKSACSPIPSANLKVGDVVQAPWSSGNYSQATVKEVNAAYGRAMLVFDIDKEKTRAVPIRDIITDSNL